MTTTCARCPEPATAHLRIAARPHLRVEPERVLLDEDVCSTHTAEAARDAKNAQDTTPDGALSADEVRDRILAAGCSARLAKAVMAALGMGELES